MDARWAVDGSGEKCCVSSGSGRECGGHVSPAILESRAEVKGVVRGAPSGLKATAVMSAVFSLHPDATVPPKVVTDNAFRAIGLRPVPGAWLPAHFAFGLMLGALRERIAAPRLPFALAVWTCAYATSLRRSGSTRRSTATIVAARRRRSSHTWSSGSRCAARDTCVAQGLAGERSTSDERSRRIDSRGAVGEEAPAGGGCVRDRARARALPARRAPRAGCCRRASRF